MAINLNAKTAWHRFHIHNSATDVWVAAILLPVMYVLILIN